MKIGILTFHNTTNFGSLLQTYALYKKVNDMGMKCEVIDYQCEEIVKRELPGKISEIRSITDLYRYIRYNHAKTKKYRSLCKFTKDNMMVSANQYCKSNINDTNNIYDKFLVGSDIVWGLDITNHDFTYFLEFVTENKKKFAFASSIGTDFAKLSVEETTKVQELLSQFSKIAVRENHGKETLENMISSEISVVCDPTFLLNNEEWSRYTYRINNKPYILVYFSDNDGVVMECARKIADKHSLKILYINIGKAKKGVTNIKAYSIEHFLSLIKNAEYVVTGSYHGMLFSINFNRQFYYHNRNYKSRMQTVADILGLEHRNIDKFNVDSMEQINYEIINEKLDTFKKNSTKVLAKMLED